MIMIVKTPGSQMGSPAAAHIESAPESIVVGVLEEIAIGIGGITPLGWRFCSAPRFTVHPGSLEFSIMPGHAGEAQGLATISRKSARC